MVSAEVEGFLNDLVLDVSKAALKSHQLDDMHESDAEIYLFLYIYFQRAAMRQKREDAIATSQAAIQAVLKQILVPALAQASTAGRQKQQQATAALSGGSKAAPSYRKTDDAPLVQQRTLREQLQSMSPTPNLTAFAEVIEVCRFVDQQVGAPAAFGSVNILHFVAIFVTLMPHRRLFELIKLIWETTDIPEARRVQIFYVWSVVDKQNRDALVELCEHLEARPGLTIQMLLEFFPNAEHINTSKYPKNNAAVVSAPAARPVVLTTSAVTTGRSIVHGEGDVAQVTGGPVVVAHHAAGDEDDDEEEDGRTDEDRAFWANLVA